MFLRKFKENYKFYLCPFLLNTMLKDLILF